MAPPQPIIETGVDKLVKIINSKGELSAADAAKELGVSTTVVMEWADFLEEEGIISLEYRFTKPYLVNRKLSKKEVQEKAKEFSGKKDGFIRKAEVSLNFLDREAGKLGKIKDEFDKLKLDLGLDIGHIKDELQELERYEQMKLKLDSEIAQQRHNSISKFKSLARQINLEKRQYQHILENVKKEKKELGRELQEAHSLESTEKIIHDRINNLNGMIGKFSEKINKEEGSVKHSEERIGKLSRLADSIQQKVQKEKEQIDPLLKESEEQKKKILDLQNQILKKIGGKESKLKTATAASKKFKTLFKQKIGMIDHIERVNRERTELHHELESLIKKAQSFQLSANKADIDKQIRGIEKKFKDVEEKKKFFEKELNKISSFFK